MIVELFQIQNKTGGSLIYRGIVYPDNSFVPIREIVKSGYIVQRAKLWGKDSGRTLTGKFNGTLLGIFPKITVKLAATRLSKEDIATLTELVEQEFTQIKYFDKKSQSKKTAMFYFDDDTTTLKKYSSSAIRYEDITITAVAVDKYT